MVLGFLFSHSFLPKSWISLALNDSQDRTVEFDGAGNILPERLPTTDCAAVLKIEYRYLLWPGLFPGWRALAAVGCGEAPPTSSHHYSANRFILNVLQAQSISA